MPTVRHADPPGTVHEPVLLLLPAVSTTAGAVTEPVVRLTAFVSGRVQGVGFRWWTRARALELGLSGSATNLGDGRVQVVAEGPPDRVQALLAVLRGGGPPGRVDQVFDQYSEPRGESGFAER